MGVSWGIMGYIWIYNLGYLCGYKHQYGNIMGYITNSWDTKMWGFPRYLGVPPVLIQVMGVPMVTWASPTPKGHDAKDSHAVTRISLPDKGPVSKQTRHVVVVIHICFFHFQHSSTYPRERKVDMYIGFTCSLLQLRDQSSGFSFTLLVSVSPSHAPRLEI